MHIILSILTIISLSINSPLQDEQSEWTSLLDKDLSKWETYLSYSHASLNITGHPKDSTGATRRERSPARVPDGEYEGFWPGVA